MAQTITIELTDAQWELAQKYYYYVNPDTKMSVRPTTIEELTTALFNHLKGRVNNEVSAEKARLAAEAEDEF